MRKTLPIQEEPNCKGERISYSPLFCYFGKREKTGDLISAPAPAPLRLPAISPWTLGVSNHKQLSIVEVEDTARTKDPKGNALEILNCQKKTKEEKPSLIIYKRKSTSKYLQL